MGLKDKKINITEMDEFSSSFNEFIGNNLDDFVIDSIQEEDDEGDELPIVEVPRQELIVNGDVLRNHIASQILSERVSDRLFIEAFKKSREQVVGGYQ